MFCNFKNSVQHHVLLILKLDFANKKSPSRRLICLDEGLYLLKNALFKGNFYVF